MIHFRVIYSFTIRVKKTILNINFNIIVGLMKCFIATTSVNDSHICLKLLS